MSITGMLNTECECRSRSLKHPHVRIYGTRAPGLKRRRLPNGRRCGCAIASRRGCACSSSASIRASARRLSVTISRDSRTGSGSCCTSLGLVTERIGYRDDDRLGEWGYGITNLVPRATPGIGDLRPVEYTAGWRALERKIRGHKPAVVALVGVTLYRAILPLVAACDRRRRCDGSAGASGRAARHHTRRQGVRSAQPQRAQRELQLRGKCSRRSGSSPAT